MNEEKNIDKCISQIIHVKDLSTILSVSQNTAYALVRSGAIRSIKIGRIYKILKDALDEYWEKDK